MGRKRGAYTFEKRQKELAKQKKRREKLERRQNKGEDSEEFPPGISGENPDADDEESAEAGEETSPVEP